MRNLERQMALFGRQGQERINCVSVAVIGVGGIGTHIVQQLALLGVRRFALVDPETIDETNLNRYVGATRTDAVEEVRKVDIGERIIRTVEPRAEVVTVPKELQTREALSAIKSAHVVFGCVDKESLRFVLNHFCVAFAKPLFDSATGVDGKGESLRYGGNVFVMWEPPGCLICRTNLDMEDVNRELASDTDRQNREAIYGVAARMLGDSGPSVVSLNGVIASIAVTEFMVAVTGLRKPNQRFTYWGHTGKTSNAAPAPRDCFTCALWNKKDAADPYQFLRL